MLNGIQSGPRRILVADDNLDSVETMAYLLKSMGHEVRFAIDGPTALEAARNQRPEFVFLDLGLPGMDGYQVARVLKEEMGDAVRIIAVTGYGKPEDRERSLEAGCEHHLVKPPELRVIESLLGRGR